MKGLDSSVSRFALAAGFACALAGAPALAQSEADADTQARGRILDRVVVTAQKREQSLLDVPVAVSVLDAATLESTFSSNVEDIQRLAPSITVAGNLSPTQSSVRIRGVGTNVFSVTVEPSVSFVIDGIALPRNDAGLVELADIERIEILKGPQGTLFGKNASAGVISYTTRDPSAELEGSFKVRATTDGDLRADATFSDGLGEKAAFRLTGFYSETADYLDNVFTGTEAGGGTAFGGRAKLLVEPSDTFTFKLSADYYDAEYICCSLPLRTAKGPRILTLAAGVTPGPENTSFSSDYDPVNTTSQMGVSAEAEWLMGGLRLTSLTGYRDWETGGNMNEGDFFASDGLNTPVIGATGLQQQAYQEAQTLSQELRVAPVNPGRLDFVAGAFYYKNQLGRFFDRNTQVCFGAAAPVGGACPVPVRLDSFFTLNVDTENFAVFGDASYAVSDRFSLIAGLRALHDELAFETSTSSGFSGGDVLKDSDVIGRLGLQYDLTSSLTSFATFSKGYKSGAYDATIAINTAVLDGGPVDPETSEAFELGLRGSPPGMDNLYFDLSAFHNSYENFHAQSFDASGAGGSKLLNAGETTTKGVELNTTWEPTRNFSLLANILYLDAEFAEFDGVGCYPGQTLAQGCRPRPGGRSLQDVSGGSLPNAPEWKYMVLPRYEWLSGNGSAYFLQAMASYQSQVLYNINQDPRAAQDGYTLVDFSAGYVAPDQKFSFTVFMKNALDEFYVNTVDSTFLNDPGGYYQIVPRGASRITGAELAFRF